MFDSALAFTRYRLEVVNSWPEGEEKSALLAAIEHAMRRQEEEQNGRKDPKASRRFTMGAWRSWTATPLSRSGTI